MSDDDDDDLREAISRNLLARSGNAEAATMEFTQDDRRWVGRCFHGFEPEIKSASKFEEQVVAYTKCMKCLVENELNLRKCFEEHEGARAHLSQQSDQPAFVFSKCVDLRNDCMSKFWSKNSNLVDQNLVTMCYLCATNHVIDGDILNASCAASMAFFLEEWITVGQDECIAALNTTDENSITECFERLLYKITRTTSERSLILFFAEKISCSCLDEKKHEVEARPEMGHCSSCERVDEKANFRKCSNCKTAQYCDEVCQRKDWPLHKRICRDSCTHLARQVKKKGKKGAYT